MQQPAPLSIMRRLVGTKHVPRRAKRPLAAVLLLIQDFIRCNLLQQASAMAYVTLLSLVPSLVAIFCVLSLFSPLVGTGSHQLVTKLRTFILDNLASSSGQAVVTYLEQMLSSLDLKTIGWSSFASVLVTLILLLRQIEEALNGIWLIRKSRNIFTRFMYFWTFLTFGMVVLAIMLGVSTGFNLQGLMSGVNRSVSSAAAYGRWIPGWTSGVFFFFFLYKVVPNCRVLTKNAAVGAVVASTLLQCASALYGLFVKDAKSYTTLYGALAQLPLFLTWLYICWTIILLGALIGWRMQEGFPASTQEESLDRTHSARDIMRNNQLKAGLPELVLLAIYCRFHEGKGGCTPQTLAQRLKLPLSWITDACEGLAEMGYIVAAKTEVSENGEAAVDITEPYFPAIPPDNVSLGALLERLEEPSRQWLAAEEHPKLRQISRTLHSFFERSKAARDVSLAEVVAALSAASKDTTTPAFDLNF